MKKRPQFLIRSLLLLVLGIIAVLGIIVVVELTVIAKNPKASEAKIGTDRQAAYPPPAVVRANSNAIQSNSYPPPATAAISPTKKAIASPTSAGGLSLVNVPKVTVKDAKVALDANNAVFVDVRTKDAFDRSHIPGALSMPESQVSNRFNELDANQWIITYCS